MKLMKGNFFHNVDKNFTPQIVKRRSSSTLEKNILINQKTVTSRQIVYKEKKIVDIEQP